MDFLSQIIKSNNLDLESVVGVAILRGHIEIKGSNAFYRNNDTVQILKHQGHALCDAPLTFQHLDDF